ncbi:MAG: sigma-54-dependent Fis family transcriptional regulator [Gemmatimonadales bacterium]|nr:MAG: sigma-54-dependent Fis family transcriptional regulator [Gemmatimonadales bacterium]
MSDADRILLVEDDEGLRRAVAEVLGAGGFQVSNVSRADDALERLQEETFDLVLTDLVMPGMRGEALVEEMARAFPEIPVIVLTAFGSVEGAMALTRAGAADYLTKPFRTSALMNAIQRVLEGRRSRQAYLRARERVAAHLEGIMGESPPMRRLFDRIGRVAQSMAPVLISGETGSGKELVARSVHQASGRDPFLPVNCGALPETLLESELFGHARGAFTGADRAKPGLFEAADGGTLLLDEIGDLPLALQPKLLRALESGEIRRVGEVEARPVEVRIVAATHQDLEAAVQAGQFREDLYWRLHVLHLDVPPLRERLDDIPLLVEHGLNRIARRIGVDPPPTVHPQALELLGSCPWPGNVRQLFGALERAVVFAAGREIRVEDLPPSVRRGSDRVERISRAADQELSLADLEREYVLEVLRRVEGNKSRAAEWLGIPRRTLYRRLAEYGKD